MVNITTIISPNASTPVEWPHIKMAEIGPHLENEQSRLHLLYFFVLPTLALSSGLEGEALQGTCK